MGREDIERRLVELELEAGVAQDRLEDAVKRRQPGHLEIEDIGINDSLGTPSAKAIFRVTKALDARTLDVLIDNYSTVVFRPAVENDREFTSIVVTLDYADVVDPDV